MGEGEPERIRLGLSACLLGEEVRFDTSVTPSSPTRSDRSSSGSPCVPRSRSASASPARPFGSSATRRRHLVVQRIGEDLTTRMRRYAADKVRELERLNLDG